MMRVFLSVKGVDKQCCSNILTVGIPGLASDIWLCISVEVRFWFWDSVKVWAVHLV